MDSIKLNLQQSRFLGESLTVTADFFLAQTHELINLTDPLAVLATRLPWTRIQASLAAKVERRVRTG